MKKRLLLVFALALLCTSCSFQNRPEESGAESNPASSEISFSSSEEQPPEVSEESSEPESRKEYDFSPFERLELSCKSAFVFEPENGVIFYKGEPEAKLYPASITKLYTAHVALQHLQPEDVITVGDEVSLVLPGSSIAYVQKGHRLTAEMLVEGMLLPSGNDAAYVLAAAAGRAILSDAECDTQTALKAFLEEMNRQAIRDGLVHTHFTSPDGFHEDGHYTCMRDLARIAQIAVNDEMILRYAGLQQARVIYKSGEVNVWTSTNLLLDESSEYYRPSVIGLKTGHTEEAGYCLLSAEKVGERTVIAGVFGCETSESRFGDSTALLDTAETVFKE